MKKIENKLDQLYSMRTQSIENEDFREAEKINGKIKDFINTSMEEQNKKLDYAHEKELMEFDSNYKKEMDDFKSRWKEAEKNAEEEFATKEKELEKTLNSEKKKVALNTKESFKKKPVPPDYLNLKKIQAELIKQERYAEAENVKKRAQKILTESEKKSKIELDNRLRVNIANNKKRQEEERKRFEDMKERKKLNMEREKNKEYEQIVAKFRTIKVDMTLKSKENKMKAEKKLSKFYFY
ncbi:MAG: hypothetical protein MJ252_12090 [archaeon]|nr:hypothetical protein [archaeon]